jgi:hypothetical protein
MKQSLPQGRKFIRRGLAGSGLNCTDIGIFGIFKFFPLFD